MKVTLLLADSAQEVGNKLYILGGGWTNITPGSPFAIAGKIEVPWNEGSSEHEFRLELLDIDGHPVRVPQIVGEGADEEDAPEGQPIGIEGTFSTGIPAGIKPGTPLDAVFAINIAGLPLEPAMSDRGRLVPRVQHEADATTDGARGVARHQPSRSSRHPARAPAATGRSLRSWGSAACGPTSSCSSPCAASRTRGGTCCGR